jgi:ribokinase
MVARVERYPEEDDEVFVSDLNLFSGGAAANTAYACAKLGLKTAFIGKLGRNDIFGSKILHDFNKVKVETDFLKYSDEFNTGSAYVALSEEGERRIYAYSGAANYLSKADIIEEELSQTKLLYLSSLKNIEAFIQAAEIGKKNKIPIIFNPGMLVIEQGLAKIENLLRKIDIMIISRKEFKALNDFKKENIDPKTIKKESHKFFSFGLRVLIVTMGEKGALILTPNDFKIIPPIKMDLVVDTTGAGDAFSAGFIYGFIQNSGFIFEDLKKNVKIGNFIAGKCIEKLGARSGIPEKGEIELE